MSLPMDSTHLFPRESPQQGFSHEQAHRHPPSRAIVPFTLCAVLSARRDGTRRKPVPPINIDVVMDMQAKGIPFAKHGGLGHCTICGARFKTGEVWKHEPTGCISTSVGTAPRNTNCWLTGRSSTYRWSEHGGRETNKTKANRAERAEFLAAHPGLAEARMLFCTDRVRSRCAVPDLPQPVCKADRAGIEAAQRRTAATSREATRRPNGASSTGKTEFVGRVVKHPVGRRMVRSNRLQDAGAGRQSMVTGWLGAPFPRSFCSASSRPTVASIRSGQTGADNRSP